MTTFGAILLLAGGLVGVVASWNAVRPLIDPTRRYSPSWLPAMVVAELAPFWLLVHAVVLGLGLALGGWGNLGGRIGVGLLVLSALMLCWMRVRSALAVSRLDDLVVGSIPRARGPARLFGRPVSTPPGVEERHGVPWSGSLTLDVVMPANGPTRAPVAVYVHGGGWRSGAPQRQARDLYHALALDGWVILAIRYPFAPQVSVEQQVEAVKAAVRWARAELADAVGVEATHLVSIGGSAGAHLAVTAAMTAEHETEQVTACVGLYGIYDMANRNQRRPHWAMIGDDVMRELPVDAPSRYDRLSPLCLVDDRTPSMLIVHGTRDTLVPIGEAEQFVDALCAEGRPVEFVPVPGAQHAFDALSSPVTRATAAVVRDWLRATVLDR